MRVEVFGQYTINEMIEDSELQKTEGRVRCSSQRHGLEQEVGQDQEIITWV